MGMLRACQVTPLEHCQEVAQEPGPAALPSQHALVGKWGVSGPPGLPVMVTAWVLVSSC